MVEIEGLDTNMCCGTHVSNLSHLQVRIVEIFFLACLILSFLPLLIYTPFSFTISHSPSLSFIFPPLSFYPPISLPFSPLPPPSPLPPAISVLN